MDRNPLFTKERATFHFHKIENYYKQNAYKQALAEIEQSRDLLGAALNMGQQVTLTKILTNSLINTMYDLFLVDGDTENFDRLYTTYKTHLELHTNPETYSAFSKFFLEKDKSAKFKSKTDTIGKIVKADESLFIDTIKQEPIQIKSEAKKQEAIDIEADFLASIGAPLFAPADAIIEIQKDKKVDSFYPQENDIDQLFETATSNVTSEELFEKPTKKSSVVSEFYVDAPSEKPVTKKRSSYDSNKPKKKKSSISQETKESKPKPKNSKPPVKKKKKKKPQINIFAIVIVVLVALLLFGGYYMYSSGILADIFSNEPVVEETLEEDIVEEPVIEEPEILPEPEPEPEPEISYILPSDTVLLTNADLQNMTSKEIRLAINEMFARKGWNFGSSGNNYDYFMSQSWYQPDPNMTSPNEAESQFSSIERSNLQFMLNYEKNA